MNTILALYTRVRADLINTVLVLYTRGALWQLTNSLLRPNDFKGILQRFGRGGTPQRRGGRVHAAMWRVQGEGSAPM